MIDYQRMPIEIESPEQMGYSKLKYNLTESSFRDMRFGDLKLNLNKITLCYGDHLGHVGLRKMIATDYQVKPEHILLVPGAAAGLFIVATSLLGKEDRILVVYPNYGTNLETPRALGVAVDRHEVTFENQWQINIEKMISQITPKTKLISITHPHNPTGTRVSLTTLQKLIAICEAKKIFLLVDETYRDMDFSKDPLPPAASLSTQVISVSSLSKTYGLPGIRMGWIATKNSTIFEKFLAAKEQIFLTGSMLDEEVAYQFLLKKKHFFPAIKKQIKSHQKIVMEWLDREKELECIRPEAGVVCFPRFKSLPKEKWDLFYRTLNETYGAFVGPGHWFLMEKRYFRLGFGWPTTKELQAGLSIISRTLSEVSRKK